MYSSTIATLNGMLSKKTPVPDFNWKHAGMLGKNNEKTEQDLLEMFRENQIGIWGSLEMGSAGQQDGMQIDFLEVTPSISYTST